MNRILTCPHCGPTLTEARLRCDRCGRELVYVSDQEFSSRRPARDAPAASPPKARHPARWVFAAGAVAVVIAAIGFTLPGGRMPDSPAAPALAITAQPAPPPAAAAPAGLAGQTGSRPAVSNGETIRPGDLAQALERYRAALAEKPADAELLDNVGRILLAMNNPADAVPFLEHAVEAEPFGVGARFDLAVAYARSGKLKEAVSQYETLAGSDGADVRVYHNLGLALRQLGRHADAAAAFGRATVLEPGEARGWRGLALSLEADGRGAEAAAALERCLALEPSSADADNVRARIARLRAVAEPLPASPDEGIGAGRR